jgi:pSer/pThr/pTyr-binding forkhead associated (FHA) protein
LALNLLYEPALTIGLGPIAKWRGIMATRITLTVVEGPHRGEELSCVVRTQITIGRSEECTFQLRGAYEDLLISRRHCLIAVHPDRVEIRDLESRNGTYVNSQRLGFPGDGERAGSTVFKQRLQDGDALHVGTSVMRVGIGEVAEEEAANLESMKMLTEYLADE